MSSQNEPDQHNREPWTIQANYWIQIYLLAYNMQVWGSDGPLKSSGMIPTIPQLYIAIAGDTLKQPFDVIFFLLF